MDKRKNNSEEPEVKRRRCEDNVLTLSKSIVQRSMGFVAEGKLFNKYNNIADRHILNELNEEILSLSIEKMEVRLLFCIVMTIYIMYVTEFIKGFEKKKRRINKQRIEASFGCHRMDEFPT